MGKGTYSMRKVVVTGGAGFVGTNLIKRLVKEGHQVWSIDNYATGFKENHQDGCTYVDEDVNTTEFDFSSIDVIYHLAALARIQPSIRNPKQAIDANVSGTLNILDIARQYDIPVVYAGSSSKHHGLWGSPYAWSKYAGEQLCELYNKVYGLSTVICRFYNVYGPHQIESGTYATVLGIFQRQFRNKQPLTITGTGEQRRDFTHADDIVDALYKCIDKTFDAEIFELGRGENFSINEIADMFRCETEYIDARPGEYPYTLCDYSNAKEKLDWQPTRNLKDYINDILHTLSR
jgi:UDP-glucose 4-epimerase